MNILIDYSWDFKSYLTMIYLFPSLCLISFTTSIYLHLFSISFPLSSMRVDEPGDPRPRHIHGLRRRERPAVPDGRDAHPPSLHPEERGRLAPDLLPAQPQPGRGELHAGRPSAGPNQRSPAQLGVWAALAEVHHLLRERLRWVGGKRERLNVSYKHGFCM